MTELVTSAVPTAAADFVIFCSDRPSEGNQLGACSSWTAELGPFVPIGKPALQLLHQQRSHIRSKHTHDHYLMAFWSRSLALLFDSSSSKALNTKMRRLTLHDLA